jgi:hypothetical protein
MSTSRPLIAYIRVSTSRQGRSGLGLEVRSSPLKARRAIIGLSFRDGKDIRTSGV